WFPELVVMMNPSSFQACSGRCVGRTSDAGGGQTVRRAGQEQALAQGGSGQGRAVPPGGGQCRQHLVDEQRQVDRLDGGQEADSVPPTPQAPQQGDEGGG